MPLVVMYGGRASGTPRTSERALHIGVLKNSVSATFQVQCINRFSFGEMGGYILHYTMEQLLHQGTPFH